MHFDLETAQFFETPFVIVSVLECAGGNTNLFNVFEQPPMDSRLLHGSIETFGDEGVAGRHPSELDLGAEVVRCVVRAVIHSQGQSAAGVSFDQLNARAPLG
ncbi:MAG: hypothetical protein VB125_05770 [Burkholderia sp.]